MKFCPNCGSPVEPGNRFCSSCGFNLFKYSEDLSAEKDALQAPARKTSLRPDGMPSEKPLKEMTISPVGITFDCKKAPFSRQDVLEKIAEGSPVLVEKYEYKGEDAYLLIDQPSGRDFGVIYAELAAEISETYPDCRFEGYISKTDSFYSEDEEDELFTCRVKLYILSPASKANDGKGYLFLDAKTLSSLNLQAFSEYSERILASAKCAAPDDVDDYMRELQLIRAESDRRTQALEK